MALGPRLDLRQSQSLVMTPQLQQAIRLLQMSNLELSDYVEQEIEANPLLEHEESEGGIETPEGPAEDAAATESSGDDSYADEPDAPDSAEMANSETFLESDSAPLDTDYENVWDASATSDGGQGVVDDRSYLALAGSGNRGEDGPDLENVAANEATLRDHLLGQANIDLGDPVDRMIAVQLVEMIDDAGYLNGSLSQVAEALGCEPERVAYTLELVKRFDPPGVFARNLSECLSLQLADRGRLTPMMEALLDNLDLLAKRDFMSLRRVCGVSSDDLARMVQDIKALNPKPASEFDHIVAQPVTPDVTVRSDGKGGWLIELNSETLPRVLVNSRYFAVVKEKAQRKSDQEFLIDCYQSANWLVKSLQQRAQTILKVATELVRQQEDFFTMGVQHLKPLTLRDVAEVVGVHESTVSRVTNNKYIGISRGVFEMKYFFTSAIGQGDSGDSHSAESIRFLIRGLIDGETADTVLSDDKIVEILHQDGVDIARRTVAKYRDSMRIPSSVQRRREKALHA